MVIYKIYVLCEPGTEEARYVGITQQTLKVRLTSHLSEARRRVGVSHRGNWIRKLLDQGLKPDILLVEETDNPEREGYWIETFREAGYRLTNGRETRSTLEAAISHQDGCRKRSDDLEYRYKISVAAKRRYENNEQLESHREMCRKRSADPEYREKLKEAWKSRPRPTHCKHGHTLEDAYLRPNGRRTCKHCSAIRCKEYQRKLREKGK